MSTDCMLLTDLGTWAVDTDKMDKVFIRETQEMGAMSVIKC